MLIALALIFIATPLLEIYLFIRVGEWVGALPVIGLLLFAAAAGVAVIRFAAPRAIGTAQDSLRAGAAPVREVMDGVAIVVAGCLLIAPGFLTDAVGLLLLVPWVRRGIGYALLSRVLRPMAARTGPGASGVVDGDYDVVRRPGDGGPPPRLPPSG